MKATIVAEKIHEIDMVDEVVPGVTASWDANDDCLMVGAIPHSFLFHFVDGVVHHGGAGTTAAGIKAEKPTWICPFFGDQFFWGEMIYKNGYSLTLLTHLTHSLSHSLTYLLTHPLIQVLLEQ